MSKYEYKGCDKISFQEKICRNTEEKKKYLDGYISVDSKYFEHIPEGSFIRYITGDGRFRLGGKLKKNMAPKYFVLSNGYKKVSWCVNLETNYIYIRNDKKIMEDKVEKDNLYKLYQAGYVKILDEPEIVESEIDD